MSQTTRKPIHKSAKISLSRRQAQALIKQIGSLCEKAYRRGAQQARHLGLTKDDASWYRYECGSETFRGEPFHLIAHRMPEHFNSQQTKDWPKAARSNPGQYYARKSRRTAIEVHGLEYGHCSKAYAELDKLVCFANLK